PGEQGGPVGGVDGHHGGGQVEALEQGLVLAVREDQSAVGEGGIARQGLAAPRRIESGDDDLGARRRGQQVQVFGGAGEQEPDVRRLRLAGRGRRRGQQFPHRGDARGRRL